MGLAVPLIWGLGVVFAKAAIGHFPPVLLMALRFTLTALVLVWFVKPPWCGPARLSALIDRHAWPRRSILIHPGRPFMASKLVSGRMPGR